MHRTSPSLKLHPGSTSFGQSPHDDVVSDLQIASCDKSLKRVLFLPSNDWSLSEMLYVANCLQRKREYRSAFLMTVPCRGRWLERIRRQGHDLHVTPNAEQTSGSPNVVAPLGKPFPNTNATSRAAEPATIEHAAPEVPSSRLRKSLSFIMNSATIKFVDQSIGRLCAPLNHHVTRIDAARWLSQLVPRLLVIADHGDTASEFCNDLQLAILNEARQRGIPTLSLCGELWPRQFDVDAQSSNQANDPDSSLRDGLYSVTRMALENSIQLKVRTEYGQQSSQLRVTGRASFDIAVQNLRQIEQHRSRICQDFGLRPDRAIVLCAVPHLVGPAPNNSRLHDEHYRELFALLHRVGDVSVLLHPHPSSEPSAYRLLASQHGLPIATEHALEELVPVSDTVLCSWSPAMVLAMACGKPIMQIGIADATPTRFDDHRGVATFRDWRDAHQILRRLLRDRDYRLQMIDAQRRELPEWVIFDGRSTERLLTEIDFLSRPATISRRMAA
ncbi:MAG: hypothetical protein RIS70_2468 [Planctomycetota bacterium]|jgi:hypothetical protein